MSWTRRNVTHWPRRVEASEARICARHVDALRKSVASTKGLTDAGVLDDLVTCIDAMVRIIRPESEVGEADRRVRPAVEFRLAGTAHAVARYGQDFTTGELLVGNAVLRHSVKYSLREELGRRPNSRESDLIHALLDELGAASAVSFADLREQRARLEAEAMSRFLAALSHDLRGALSGATLSLGLISRGLASNDLSTEQAGELARDATDARHLIDGTLHTMTRVLEAERLRAGAAAVTVKPRKVELAPLMAGVARAVARSADAVLAEDLCGDEDTDKAVVFVSCEPTVLVETDPDLLTSILLNFLRNAIRYAGDAGPITLKHEESVGDDGGTRISVCDCGPGLAEGQASTLFDRFHRGAGSHTSGGSGLGLFIARCAADLLEARLEVESEPGGGATFSIILPANPPTPIVQSGFVRMAPANE